MTVPEITTSRLLLRGFDGSDIEPYALMVSDPEVMRHVGPVLGPDDAWRHLSMFAGHWALRGYGSWAAVERSSGLFVGRVGLWHPTGWPDLEVGWMLSRKFWGKGYAYEAAMASCEFAFLTMGVGQLCSVVHPENARSIRLARRLGQEFLHSMQLRGAEIHVYGMTQEQWARTKSMDDG